jgi:hypothetical protein
MVTQELYFHYLMIEFRLRIFHLIFDILCCIKNGENPIEIVFETGAFPLKNSSKLCSNSNYSGRMTIHSKKRKFAEYIQNGDHQKLFCQFHEIQ